MCSSSRERGHQTPLLVMSKVAPVFVVFPQLPHLSAGFVSTIPLSIARLKILDKVASSRFTEAGALCRSYLVTDSRLCFLNFSISSGDI